MKIEREKRIIEEVEGEYPLYSYIQNEDSEELVKIDKIFFSKVIVKSLGCEFIHFRYSGLVSEQYFDNKVSKEFYEEKLYYTLKYVEDSFTILKKNKYGNKKLPSKRKVFFNRTKL